MNYLLHMSYVVVLDYLIFQYWYVFANRFDVLLFDLEGFLPERYIVSGLVGGALVYWLYLIPVSLLKKYYRRYQHPRWWLLWIATAFISTVQVMTITLTTANPALRFGESLALVAHLQGVHLIMFMVARRVMLRGQGAIIPGLRPGLIFMADWLFWLWLSFALPERIVLSKPHVGSAIERYVLGAILLVFITIGIFYRAGYDPPRLPRDRILIPLLEIRVSDLVDSFYAAWALFYMLLPALHYVTRGYVTAHSNLFPAFLLGLLIPGLWSLLVMWFIILVSKPQVSMKLPRLLLDRIRAVSSSQI